MVHLNFTTSFSVHIRQLLCLWLWQCFCYKQLRLLHMNLPVDENTGWTESVHDSSYPGQRYVQWNQVNERSNELKLLHATGPSIELYLLKPLMGFVCMFCGHLFINNSYYYIQLCCLFLFSFKLLMELCVILILNWRVTETLDNHKRAYFWVFWLVFFFLSFSFSFIIVVTQHFLKAVITGNFTGGSIKWGNSKKLAINI